MTTEQLIEKVVTKQRKILAEATTFDEMAIRIEKLIREALSTIASKVAEEAKEEERQRIIDLLTSGKGRETGIWHYELNDHSEMEASYTGDYLSLKEVIGQLTNPKESNQ